MPVIKLTPRDVLAAFREGCDTRIIASEYGYREAHVYKLLAVAREAEKIVKDSEVYPASSSEHEQALAILEGRRRVSFPKVRNVEDGGDLAAIGTGSWSDNSWTVQTDYAGRST
jgi:hypothetical protein